MRFTAKIVAASAIAFAGFGAVHAAPPQLDVEFTTGQLMSAQGRAAIQERIQDAAEDVCAVDDRRDLSLRAEQRSCIAEAVQAAQAQLQIKMAEASERRLAGSAQLPDNEG